MKEAATLQSEILTLVCMNVFSKLFNSPFHQTLPTPTCLDHTLLLQPGGGAVDPVEAGGGRGGGPLLSSLHDGQVSAGGHFSADNVCTLKSQFILF